jgi:hypothetical protein
MRFIVYLGGRLIAAALAHNKGRSFWGFLLLSVFLTPLIGILAAAVAVRDQHRLDQIALGTGMNRKCPHCAEIVKIEATKCRICGSTLPGST